MTKIQVIDKTSGWFSGARPVTTQRFEENGDGDQELIYCDHANAQYEEETFDFLTSNANTVEHRVGIYVCDRCEAYRREGEKEWENEPGEGKHYEY